MFKTINASMYEIEPGADRTDVGKVRLDLKLEFDTSNDAIRWMQMNGISTKDFQQVKPDPHIP